MNWIEQVTILDLLVKGLVIGVVVSAPLGPVGVLCIQRTLNKGRWYGFVTGLGACLSDIIYALITGYGMSFMDEFLTKNQVLLQIIGSVMLFLFGVFQRCHLLLPYFSFMLSLISCSFFENYSEEFQKNTKKTKIAVFRRRQR
jgi:cytochrome c biogenesis protein CcdA